jgi:hypothetical protein
MLPIKRSCKSSCCCSNPASLLVAPLLLLDRKRTAQKARTLETAAPSATPSGSSSPSDAHLVLLASPAKLLPTPSKAAVLSAACLPKPTSATLRTELLLPSKVTAVERGAPLKDSASIRADSAPPRWVSRAAAASDRLAWASLSSCRAPQCSSERYPDVSFVCLVVCLFALDDADHYVSFYAEHFLVAAYT